MEEEWGRRDTGCSFIQEDLQRRQLLVPHGAVVAVLVDGLTNLVDGLTNVQPYNHV